MGAGREGGPDRQLEIPSSAAGYVTLLSFVAEHVDRPKRLADVARTGSSIGRCTPSS